MLEALTWWPSFSSSPWIRWWPQAGFSVASRPARARTSALTGRRPVRFGYVHFLATSRSCHRRIVPGVTSRCARSVLGRCRISAARTARSAQSIRGLGWVRRSTATSWRRMRISVSLDAEDRPQQDEPSAKLQEDQVQQAYRHGRPSGPRARPFPDPHPWGSQPLADFWHPTGKHRIEQAGADVHGEVGSLRRPAPLDDRAAGDTSRAASISQAGSGTRKEPAMLVPSGPVIRNSYSLSRTNSYCRPRGELFVISIRSSSRVVGLTFHLCLQPRGRPVRCLS
jgi:hypothetical protein